MCDTEYKSSFFATQLLEWYKDNARDHPWKFIKDPYKVWVSEIILQQTRVESGRAYYHNFIKTFPNIKSLAVADIDQVYQVWKGLGYYSRARNMHSTAQVIVDQYNGKFPEEYHLLLELKGIGPYTAAAISSFAFNLPYPVVDGNVIRVMSRIFGIKADTSLGKTKKLIEQFAKTCLGNQKPSLYNQAILDFGATVCKPKATPCHQCPMSEICFAFQHSLVSEIPRKKKKITIKERFFHFIVIKDQQDQVLFRKREEKDIWAGLVDFPLLEKDNINPLMENEIALFVKENLGIVTDKTIRIIGPKSQKLTHQKIGVLFYELLVHDLKASKIKKPYLITSLKKMSTFAVPKVIDWYLKDNSIYLFS